MKRLIFSFTAAVLLLPSVAGAQSVYDRGYSAGYNDLRAPSPSAGIDYRRGYNYGQGDADDEMMQQMAIQRADEARHQAEMNAIGEPKE